uniref:Interleukin-7 n=1 Tax=Bos indicus x Bos taurus TaxID=30522 RepID=A0A4W2HX41_BOBOX
MGFPRKEYWSGLPLPSSRDLPDQGIEPECPALQADSLLSEPPENLLETYNMKHYFMNDNMINFDSNCLNNEPNFFKKHSCDDNKEASFLNRASRKLRQFLKMNISDDFKLHLSTVSQGTLTLLNCTSKGKGRKPPSLSEAQPTKNLEENKSSKEQKKQNDLCFLKILLQKIKTCWNKILRGIKEH